MANARHVPPRSEVAAAMRHNAGLRGSRVQNPLGLASSSSGSCIRLRNPPETSDVFCCLFTARAALRISGRSSGCNAAARDRWPGHGDASKEGLARTRWASCFGKNGECRRSHPTRSFCKSRQDEYRDREYLHRLPEVATRAAPRPRGVVLPAPRAQVTREAQAPEHVVGEDGPGDAWLILTGVFTSHIRDMAAHPDALTRAEPRFGAPLRGCAIALGCYSRREPYR